MIISSLSHHNLINNSNHIIPIASIITILHIITIFPSNSFVHKSIGNPNIGTQIQSAQSSQNPVKVMEIWTVQIIIQPFPAAPGGGGGLDDRDNGAAQEVSDSDDADVGCGTQAPHGLRHLVVEKFLETDDGEGVGDATEHVLWN